MKRILKVLILLALTVLVLVALFAFVAPAFAQDDNECPGVRCPEEQLSPGCQAAMAALVLVALSQEIARKK